MSAIVTPPFPSEGPRVQAFIQKFVRHTRGDHAGQLVSLDRDQADAINRIFTLTDDPAPVWQHREVMLGRPRKWGKSEIASGLALYALVAAGEQGADVFAAAGSRDQARLVFDNAKRVVELDPSLSKRLKVYKSVIEDPTSGSVFRVLAADGGLNHGLNPFFTVVDELHVHPDGELYEALATGSGARSKSLMVTITTAGAGRESYCYEKYDYGKRVASGEIDDAGFLLDWREPAQPDCDHTDPAVWAEAHPGLGKWISLEWYAGQCKRLPEAEFRRLLLNQFVADRTAWLPTGTWDACAIEDADRDVDAAGAPLPLIAPGEVVTLGVDGSWSNDSTGIVAATKDGRVMVVAAWERQPHDDEHWRVDIADVMAAIRAACRTYTVLEVAFDPYRWQMVMHELAAEGVPVVEFPQSPARMVKATQTFYDAAVEGDLVHDGDPQLARHVDNTHVKVDRFGARITKDARGSQRKIDLAVCAVMAYERAQFAEVAPTPGVPQVILL